MALTTIRKRHPSAPPESFWLPGFRPWFLLALLYSIVSLVVWFASFTGGYAIPVAPLSIITWHGHEMVFGYTVAVIIGFLLTAVPQWTGCEPLTRRWIIISCTSWILARVLLMSGIPAGVALGLAADTLTMLTLLSFVTVSIVRAKQLQQIGILAVLFLLVLCNLLVYCGSLGWIPSGTRLGLHGSIFLIVVLIITIGGRVMPAFIENGVGLTGSIKNPRWLARTLTISLVVFSINQLFVEHVLTREIAAFFAAALLVLRLSFWHTLGLWRKPLLWGLYGAHMSIAIGLALYALGRADLGLHAFTVGGIGLSTLSMMVRVARGHSGLSIHISNPLLWCGLLLVASSFVLRVITPLPLPLHYVGLVSLAQVSWVVGNCCVLIDLWPILLPPRSISTR